MAALKTAMILAAGRGERLQPLTRVTPKPLLVVRGQPLIAHQLNWLREAGIESVVINLHHLGEQIEAFCGNGDRWGLNIRYSHEQTLLETGGGIQNALPLLGGEAFLVVNGDIFTTFTLATLSTLPAWADMHLLLTPRPEFRESGDFEYANGRVTARGDGFVYCGIAILHPGIFREVRQGAFSLRDLMFAAIAAGRGSAQVWDGYWTDIGSRAQLDAVNADPMD